MKKKKEMKLKMIRHETTTVMWSECTACIESSG
jgi:hypothetical protein